jgi:hypothetical protein
MNHRFEYGAVCGVNQDPEPLFYMCDNIHLARTNALATALFGPRHCLRNVDPSILLDNLKNRGPTRAEFYEMFITACDMARKSPVWNEAPPFCEGVPKLDVIATLFLFTMQEPYPAYRLVTDVFALTGQRAVFKEQRSFIKLLLIAQRCIPLVDQSLYQYSGSLFFGFRHHPASASVPVECLFPVGQNISLAAPTFCSACADDVKCRYPEEGVCVEIVGAASLKLAPGVLSSFCEEEYLPVFPLKVHVNSCERADHESFFNGWIVTLEVVANSNCYLSAFKDKAASEDDEDDYVGRHFQEKKHLTVDASSSTSSSSVAAADVVQPSSTSSFARLSGGIRFPSTATLKAADLAAIVCFL